MKFTQALAFLASAVAVVATNTVTFVSQDDTTRTIKFTPNAGLEEIHSVEVCGGENKTVEIPHGWIGNWHAVAENDTDTGNGMLGEVAFNSWGGITFFDVSAIVNDTDKHNVKMIYPKVAKTPTSGCDVFPCNNVYVLPDDVQTKATTETDLICTLGTAKTVSARDLEDEIELGVERKWVLGRF